MHDVHKNITDYEFTVHSPITGSKRKYLMEWESVKKIFFGDFKIRISIKRHHRCRYHS